MLITKQQYAKAINVDIDKVHNEPGGYYILSVYKQTLLNYWFGEFTLYKRITHES